MKRILVGLLSLTMLCCAARAENFVGPDTDIVTAAEQARNTSAIYWTGKPLPGDWYRPCPIEYRSEGSGQGRTTFRFDDGEVLGWNMMVAGSREMTLRNVIPHEVDHMVRASLVRRPIPRWLDEGCASLWEQPSEREKLYQAARQSTTWVSESTLSLEDYPTDPEKLAGLYGFGLTMTETLLERGSPEKLLTYSMDSRPNSEKLQEYYELSESELIQVWKVHLKQCGPNGCYVPYPAALPKVRMLPILEVWSQQDCPPCQKFWSDYSSDAAFRQQINSRFHVHHRRLGPISSIEAMAKGVLVTPTFVFPGHPMVGGYSTKEKLLTDLGIVGKPATVPDVIKEEELAPEPPPLVVPDAPKVDAPIVSSVPDPALVAAQEAAQKAQDEADAAKAAQEAAAKAAQEQAVKAKEEQEAALKAASEQAAKAAAEAKAREEELKAALDQANKAKVEVQQPVPTSTPPVSLPDIIEKAPSVPSGGFWSLMGTVVGLGLKIVGGAIGGPVGLLVGSVGGAAVPFIWKRLTANWRRKALLKAMAPDQTSCVPTNSQGGVAPTAKAPFPRYLDEAGQLLEIRQSEGRVAALDALKGMFFDDAARLIRERGTDIEKQVIQKLEAQLAQKVQDIAPVSVEETQT